MLNFLKNFFHLKISKIIHLEMLINFFIPYLQCFDSKKTHRLELMIILSCYFLNYLLVDIYSYRILEVAQQRTF